MKKTIKLIDLLNKIANKEILPKVIKFHNMIFTLSDKRGVPDYTGGLHGKLFNSDWDLTNNLNDEVEIVEETEKNKETERIKKITILVEGEKSTNKFEINKDGTINADVIEVNIVGNINNGTIKEDK